MITPLRSTFVATLLTALCLAVGSPLTAQSPVPLQRIEGSITIDGRVDEAAWDALEPLLLTQKVPVEGAPPSQRTEVRIGYDANYIYLSGRLFDEEPDKIVANTKKRDDFTENTEWVGLLIDTFDDRENALAFYVTPTGSRFDMAISNDAGVLSTEWNALWDASSIRDERGWFAEIRIPFASLPFDADDGRVVMGITTFRYIARTDETAIYPERGLSSGSSFRPSLTQRFELEGVEPTRTVSITPYTLFGRAQEQQLNAAGDRYVGDSQVQREFGMDARVGLGGNVTLDFTVNTDFAQVEVDDQQLNLSRLNLFFPEKRLFFQERASLFDFAFGAVDKAFHSRRIGIAGGQPVDIYGGVRAIAKVGDWEAGFLSMQTRAFDVTPSENFGVLRLKRRVLNEASTVGLIATNRQDRDGGFNRLLGVDGTLRLFGENFLSMRLAQTDRDGIETGSALDGARVFVELADRSPLGFTYGLSYSRAGEAYDPGIGFQSRANFSEAAVTSAFNVFPSEASRWVQVGPYVNGSFIWNNDDGALESRNLTLGVLGFTKSGWSASVMGRSDLEVLARPLGLAGDLVVPTGRYPTAALDGFVATPATFRISGSVNASTGEFFGGSRHSATVAPFITVTPDLLVSGSYAYNRLSVPDAAGATQRRTLALLTGRVEYYFSTQLSASALVQHNNTADLVQGSLRIRYNPSEGNDLYIVFNGDANQTRDRTVPALPWSNRSRVQIKYSHTFRP